MAATIPRTALEYLTSEVNAISADAQERVMRVLSRVDWTNVADARALVVQAVNMILGYSTRLAAQASAEFYDAARELAVGSPLGAQAITGYVPEATEKAIRSFVRFIVVNGNVQQFNDQVLQRIDYELKRAAGNAMFENGRRDPRKPKFARVPTGPETCDFCLMLASRGFVYTSEATAGAVKLDHYHSGCDCRVVAQWSGGGVEGYDPGEIYREWQNAIDLLADERAERHESSFSEERRKIMEGYARSAKRAKQVARALKKAGSPTA